MALIQHCLMQYGLGPNLVSLRLNLEEERAYICDMRAEKVGIIKWPQQHRLYCSLEKIWLQCRSPAIADWVQNVAVFVQKPLKDVERKCGLRENMKWKDKREKQGVLETREKEDKDRGRFR